MSHIKRPLKTCSWLLLLIVTLFGMQVGFAQAPATASDEVQGALQVNVNDADAATIADILDGIGLSRAQAIVEYREQNGRFSTLDDLIEVNGIGEATIMNNRERIRFE